MILKTITDDLGNTKLSINNGLKNLFSGNIFKKQSILSNTDIKALQAYNAELERVIGYEVTDGKVKPIQTSAQTAFNRTMRDASIEAQNMAASANGMIVNLEQIPKVSKAAKICMQAFSMAGNMLVFTLITQGVQLLTKGISELNDDYADLENKISKLNNTYDEQTQSIHEIKGKLNDNQEKIEEILKLDNPTYVDLQDLENLRTQNALLENNLKLKQKAQGATSKERLEALDEEAEKTFFTNEAKTEEATRLDSAEDYFKNIFSLGMYNVYQVDKYDSEKTQYEEIRDTLDILEKLNEAKEKALSNNGVITVENRFGQKKTVTLEEINEEIQSYDSDLQSYSTLILSMLDKRMADDPNNESRLSKFLLSLNDEVTKFLDFDTYVNGTIDKALAGNRFNETGEKIKESISNGMMKDETDLLSDEGAQKLIKYVAMTIYGASNDEALKKSASYIFKKFREKIETDIQSFSSFFHSADFTEAKEKLMELARAGELTPETLELEEYNDLLTKTGLEASEAYENIMKLVSANERFSDMAGDLDALASAYKDGVFLYWISICTNLLTLHRHKVLHSKYSTLCVCKITYKYFKKGCD